MPSSAKKSCFRTKIKNRTAVGGGGEVSHIGWMAYILMDPAAPGLIHAISKIFAEEILVLLIFIDRRVWRKVDSVLVLSFE